MRDYCRECETCRGMPRGKRSPTSSELAAARFRRKLTIECEFEGQIHGARRAHRSQRLKSGIAQVGIVFVATCDVGESTHPNLDGPVLRWPNGRRSAERKVIGCDYLQACLP
jgi:hypothetical protein